MKKKKNNFKKNLLSPLEKNWNEFQNTRLKTLKLPEVVSLSI